MNKFLLSIICLFASGTAISAQQCAHLTQNNCVSFTVGQGTGCQWMCEYCANTLGTENYYFTTPVCSYEAGVGCVGSPQAGTTYTCCSI